MSGDLLQALVRARSGDESGVDEVINAMNRLVFGVALGMLGNRSDAEEVSQDIFLKLIRGSAQFASDQHLKAWARRATIHACMKRLRSRRHLLELQDVPSDPKTHHGKQAELESADLLLKALADLTERERAAFLLTVHLGLNSSEAGEALGCSAGTVRALSRRAREKLQPSIERLRTWETQNGKERPAD